MSAPYPELPVIRKMGDEAFRKDDRPLALKVIDFWRWAGSDLVGNAWRGVLAEFLVAEALGIATGVRREWDACDLCTTDGLKIEVKSAAYLQSWAQRQPSAISFDIATKRGWDAATNTTASEASRTADVYVFGLLAHRDKPTLDPLEVTQWRFYIVSTAKLQAECGSQKRIGLVRLEKLARAAVMWDELSVAVAAAR